MLAAQVNWDKLEGMKTLLLFVSALFPLLAQSPVLLIPTELQHYLALTPAQAVFIGARNASYNTLVAQKQARIAQVQRIDIPQQTAASPLDPTALGASYAEIETIRRQLAEELTNARNDIVNALGATQKTLLKTLQDAMALQSLISEAQCQNMLVPPPTGSPFFNFLPTGSLVGVLSATRPVFTQTLCLPTLSERTGDFSPGPIPAP